MEQDPFKKEESNDKNDDKSQAIRPIRTYRDDVSSLVKDQKISTSTIMLAEQKRREAMQMNGEMETEEPKTKSKIIKIFFTLFFIVLGFSTIFYVIKNDLVPEQIKNIINLNSEKEDIIRKDTKSDISIGVKNNTEVRLEIIRNVERLEVENGEVNEIVISKTLYDEEENPYEERITSNEFLNVIGTNTSDKLERSLNNEFLFGLYKKNINIPFIIFKTDESDIAFAEFYNWENQMYYDLRDIMRLKEIPDEEIIEVVEVATSTIDSLREISETSSTTTKEISVPNLEPDFNPINFTDLLILNRDVRAILDEEKNIILMYSFIDNENILITKDRETFREAVERVSSQKLLR
jgi:hypothetical protein